MKPTKRLRQLLAQPALIRAPGVHDAFSARVAVQAGAECLFLGGFGATASTLGMPDLSLLTMTEMAEAIRRACGAIDVPLIGDADTGYGDRHQIARTVREFERAGAAGLLIEDQVFPKRCGHFPGKQIVSIEEMLERLDAALQARGDDDFVIIARTDARAVDGLDLAIMRGQRFAEAGADMVFVEAPKTAEELRRVASEIDRPQLANMLTGGQTPILAADELEQLGFRIAAYPVESLMVSAWAIDRMVKTLLREGRIDGLTDEMLSFAELKDLLGIETFLRGR
ncbi:2,3-dimethylmalate lyase [Planctomycetes bacterium Pan216]|uniref:2,3-dimethylmalate lyase n=1 Tax=Kolteria novifilia TaxID=2527975 RepID=A0A518B834_9BACT|nr:2,3-dimethylmalate lyase [Planctomycetes bacterium Pan216]